MFCDKCGTALLPNQTFCGGCGKEVRGGFSIAYPRRNRVQEHIRLLGILWLALAAVSTLAGAAMIIVANTIFVHFPISPGEPMPPVPMAFLHSLLCFLGILVLAIAALEFAAGYGLLQREPWARILSMVLAFFALFKAPFGTALGIYTLWVLLPAQSDEDYAAQTRAAQHGAVMAPAPN